jgi:arylsulfatase A
MGRLSKGGRRQTFSRYLQQAGYATAIAGKWQLCLLGDDPMHPRRLGFDHWDLFGWHEGPRFYEPMIHTMVKFGKILLVTMVLISINGA